MDQTHNWNRNSKASDDDNADKQIRTSFINTGIQYMFNRSGVFKWSCPMITVILRPTIIGDATGRIFKLLPIALSAICGSKVFIPVFHRICPQGLLLVLSADRRLDISEF